jgi:hypothetical protein
MQATWHLCWCLLLETEEEAMSKTVVSAALIEALENNPAPRGPRID